MNKTRLAVLLTLLAGVVAYAAAEPIIEVYNSIRPSWFQAGLYVGPRTDATTVVANTQNKVTRMLGGSIVYDFPSQTITCADSTGLTVAGAQIGDPCFASPNIAWAANQDFTCYVSAANTVVVRFCASGTAADPASATYNVRVISNQ